MQEIQEFSIFDFLPDEEAEKFRPKQSTDWKWTFADYPKEKNGLKVFSCFACGGGSTMGYKLAGCEVLGCCEIDPKMNEVYIKALTDYFDVLLPKITPKLYTKNGPVIMMQVENEYGSYGNDHKYMQYVADLYRKHGIDVPLVTSDGPGGHFLLGGTLPDVLTTVNFGGDPDKAFANLKAFRPDSPKMCMEFWNGWFDHWGEEHQTRNRDAAKTLGKML